MAMTQETKNQVEQTLINCRRSMMDFYKEILKLEKKPPQDSKNQHITKINAVQYKIEKYIKDILVLQEFLDTINLFY